MSVQKINCQEKKRKFVKPKENCLSKRKSVNPKENLLTQKKLGWTRHSSRHWQLNLVPITELLVLVRNYRPWPSIWWVWDFLFTAHLGKKCIPFTKYFTREITRDVSTRITSVGGTLFLQFSLCRMLTMQHENSKNAFSVHYCVSGN